MDARRTPLHALPTMGLSLALIAGCGAGDEDAEIPPQEASVSITSPAEGETVQGPDVMVRLEAEGVRITPATERDPGTGHHHIFVDVDLTPLQDTIPSGAPGIIHMGQGQTEFLVPDLEPGEHRVIAVVADWAHVPLDPPAVDTVNFTVDADEAAEGEGAAGGGNE